jgi:hypothetical protein
VRLSDFSCASIADRSDLSPKRAGTMLAMFLGEAFQFKGEHHEAKPGFTATHLITSLELYAARFFPTSIIK